MEVRGVEGELKAIAEACITIRPNFSYSLQEVKDDANRVFQSGFFEKLEPSTDDTRDGVKLIFNVSCHGSQKLYCPELEAPKVQLDVCNLRRSNSASAYPLCVPLS